MAISLRSEYDVRSEFIAEKLAPKPRNEPAPLTSKASAPAESSSPAAPIQEQPVTQENSELTKLREELANVDPEHDRWRADVDAAYSRGEFSEARYNKLKDVIARSRVARKEQLGVRINSVQKTIRVQQLVNEGMSPHDANKLVERKSIEADRDRLIKQTGVSTIIEDGKERPISNRELAALRNEIKGETSPYYRTQEQQIEREKRIFEQRGLPEGVMASRSGQQLIVLKGKKPQTAGELLTRLKAPGAVFIPVRQKKPSGLQDRFVGVVGKKTISGEYVSDLSQPRTVWTFSEFDKQDFKTQLLNNTTSLGVQNVIRGSGKSDGLATSVPVSFVSPSYNKVRKDVVQFFTPDERVTEYFKGAGKEILDIGRSVVVGAGKFLYAPNYPNPYGESDKPVIDVGQEKIFKTESEPYKDPDVQTFGAAVILPIMPKVVLYGVGAVGAGYFGAKTFSKFKEKSFEEAGRASLQTGLFAIPFVKGVKSSGTTFYTRYLDPKFSPVKPQVGTLGAIEVPTSEGQVTIKIAGAQNSPTLPRMPVQEAASLSGKDVDAVSAARDFYGFFEKQKVIDKPITTQKGALEQSMFFDPYTRLRPSRLGLGQPEATPFDLFSGDVASSANRPQAILLPKTPVESFPKSLIDVEAALKTKGVLSQSQQLRLLNWQLTPSGKLKPVGFLSGEPEVTLAPKEVLVSKGVKATTLIEGRRVPVYETTIKQVGEVNPKELVVGGDVEAARSAGLRVSSTVSSTVSSSPYVGVNTFSSPLYGASLARSFYSYSPSPYQKFSYSSVPVSRSSSLNPIIKRSPSPSITPSPSPSPSITPSPSPSPSITPSPSPSPSITPSPSPSPSITPSPSPSPSPYPTTYTYKTPTPPPRKYDYKNDRKSEPGFSVFAKEQGRFVPVASGLTRKAALFEGAKYVGRTPSATFKLVKSGTVAKETKVLESEYRKALSTLRQPKNMAAEPMVDENENLFIERNKYRINTLGELRGITFKGIRASKTRRRA